MAMRASYPKGNLAAQLQFSEKNTKALERTAAMVAGEAHRLKYQEIFTLLEKHDQLKRLFAAYDITGIDPEPAP